MKKIKEYMDDILHPTLKLENSNEYFYEQLEDFYGKNNIPNNLIELFENKILYKFGFNYINENLKTHNAKKLQEKLLEYYGDEIKSFKKYEGSEDKYSFWIILKTEYNNITKKIKLNISDLRKHSGDTEVFFKLLNFFNYKYREHEIIEGHICLFIEPIYSEDATDYFNKLNRQAYHFTDKSNVKNILKNGIKLKGKSGYWLNYPERIYLWAGSDKNLKTNKDLDNFIKELFGENKTIEDLGIIKIDLYHTNFPVYKDTAMHQKEAIFIYNSIPASLCKEIKVKDK